MMWFSSTVATTDALSVPTTEATAAKAALLGAKMVSPAVLSAAEARPASWIAPTSEVRPAAAAVAETSPGTLRGVSVSSYLHAEGKGEGEGWNVEK